MIGFHVETLSDKIICQYLTSPGSGKGLFFNLGLSSLISVAVSARDMKITGFQFPFFCFRVITAPKPYEDASADKEVSSAGSKIARAGVELGFSLMALKACC